MRLAAALPNADQAGTLCDFGRDAPPRQLQVQVTVPQSVAFGHIGVKPLPQPVPVPLQMVPMPGSTQPQAWHEPLPLQACVHVSRGSVPTAMFAQPVPLGCVN